MLAAMGGLAPDGRRFAASFFGAALVAALAGCAETIPPEAEAPQGAAAPTLEGNGNRCAAAGGSADRAGGSRTARNRRWPGSRGAVAAAFGAARRHRAGIVQRCAARLVRPRRDADGAVAERHRRNAGRGGSGAPRRARGGRRYRARPAVRRVGARGRAHRPRGGRAGGGVHQRPPRRRRRGLHAGSRPRAASGASGGPCAFARPCAFRRAGARRRLWRRSGRSAGRRGGFEFRVGGRDRPFPAARRGVRRRLYRKPRSGARERERRFRRPARRRVGERPRRAGAASALLQSRSGSGALSRHRVVEGPGNPRRTVACERLVRPRQRTGLFSLSPRATAGRSERIRRASPPWATTPRRSSPRWRGGATARRASRPAR